LTDGESWRRDLWAAISRALTAHAIMLRDAAILDEEGVAALLTAVDGVGRGEPPAIAGSLSLVAAFEERCDSLTAIGSAGASRIGRARHDVAATAQRLVLRDRALVLAEQHNAARGAAIDLAESHVFTLMPAWSGSTPLQPTNLAHFLSGAIAPMGRAARRLRETYEVTDRSPMGAAALAGPGLPVDRDETSDLLGSEGPIESTFDALATIDHLTAGGETAAQVVQPMRRLISEILLWQRAEPNALRLAEELLAPLDPNLPHFRPPLALERLVGDARAVEVRAVAIGELVREIPYGPTGGLTDRAAECAAQSLQQAAAIAGAFTTMMSGPIDINRAWLARNAGRALVTAGDLGDLLMAEEGLDPGTARDITAITAQRAQQEGLEASAITPAHIDAAAMLVIGRELGLEIERLGAYLAPRRFIEKRTILGGPAAPAVRDYLAREQERLEDDRRWLDEKQRRIALAAENLGIRTQEALSAASAG
jgi:argininosuccinate lyase